MLSMHMKRAEIDRIAEGRDAMLSLNIPVLINKIEDAFWPACLIAYNEFIHPVTFTMLSISSSSAKMRHDRLVSYKGCIRFYEGLATWIWQTWYLLNL
jgi:hypothetical protein